MTDKQAITEGNISFLYRKYRSGIMSFICQQGVPYREAEDVMQDTFIRVLKFSDSYDKSGASVKTWLFQIAKHTARFNHRKKEAKRRIPGSVITSIQAVQEDENRRSIGIASEDRADDAIVAFETRAFIDEVMSTINKDFADTLLLRANGMTYKEIQKITGLPIGTIKSRIYRGRKKIVDYAA